MSVNFEIKTKKALFLNGQQITDFDWDHFDIDNINEVIVATDEEKYFALFNLHGDLLFDIGNCINYEIMSKYIWLKIISIDLPFCGLISHEGEQLLPFVFKSIMGTSNEDVLEIKISDTIKGYYIISTRQAILPAENFKSESINEYSFFMENEWKKYKLINGKYQCIN